MNYHSISRFMHNIQDTVERDREKRNENRETNSVVRSYHREHICTCVCVQLTSSKKKIVSSFLFSWPVSFKFDDCWYRAAGAMYHARYL